MQYNNEIDILESKSVLGKFDDPQNIGVINNRLEALRIISQSILKEVANIQREELAEAKSKIDLAEEVQNYEADLIRCALIRCGGRQRQAARLLGVKPTTLNAKIKRLGVEAVGVSSKL